MLLYSVFMVLVFEKNNSGFVLYAWRVFLTPRAFFVYVFICINMYTHTHVRPPLEIILCCDSCDLFYFYEVLVVMTFLMTLMSSLLRFFYCNYMSQS